MVAALYLGTNKFGVLYCTVHTLGSRESVIATSTAGHLHGRKHLYLHPFNRLLVVNS